MGEEERANMDAVTIETYQALAMRTSPDGHDRIMNGCLGLIGECGEVVDAVKKWKFQSGDHAELPREKLIEETGDVLWYCAELAEGLGEDMGKLYERYVVNLYSDARGGEAEGIEHAAVALTREALDVWRKIYDSGGTGVYTDTGSTALLRLSIALIIRRVHAILEDWCCCTLEEAMTRNIDKLKKRYPDGFSPERSIHRE